MNSMEDGRRNPGSGPWTFKTRENPGFRPSTFADYEYQLKTHNSSALHIHQGNYLLPLLSNTNSNSLGPVFL
jgi:hypothetical protein